MSDLNTKIRELYRRLSNPMAPIPTDLAPRLVNLDGIKAVIFDVYGTLICSGVGDISLIEQDDRNELIRKLLERFGGRLRPEVNDPSTSFHDLIKESHAAARLEGIEFPEVDIVEIWGSFFERFTADGLSDDLCRQFAAEYECLVNPVWPYPGLREMLATIMSAGLPMGIVSNAQFYTPLMLEAFLNCSLAEAGFDERLLVWSFVHRLGKPSVGLYEEQARRLETAHGLLPSECLYVGNDMLKDIWAAEAVGFQTALFAGDRRSLRMREDDDRCRGREIVRVVTALGQMGGLLRL
jgi:putative hydrolase of the HAD superfamily